MAILHLLLNDIKLRKMRCALTIGAVAIAVSLVTSMTSGFDSLRAAAQTALASFYGDIDVQVEPVDGEANAIAPQVVERLRGDDRIEAMRPQLRGQALLVGTEGRRGPDRPAQLIGLGVESQAALQRHPLRGGRWFNADENASAVVDESLLRRLRIEIGGTFSVATPDGGLKLTIVGTVARPAVMQIEAPTIYMPLPTLQRFLDKPDAINLIEIDLKAGQNAEDFAKEAAGWNPSEAPLIRFKTVATQQKKFDDSLQGVELFIYLGGAISMIAAVFIIFSTLTMGVMERSRTLAMLRAIGAVKGQVAGLVVLEGLVLASLGVAMGIGLGYFWIWLLAWYQPELFSHGAVLSRGGALFGGVGSLLAALLASLMPAVAATRVDPLEAMAVTSRPLRNSSIYLWAGAGLLLLAVDPLLIYAPGLERETRIPLHLYLGLPCFMFGLFAVAPLLVVIVEKVLGPVVAFVMGLQHGLVRQQLSGSVWRAAGTASALMVGLTVLILIRIHGHSMIARWQLPTRFPDMLMFAPLGLTEEQATKLDTVQGLRANQVLTVALASPKVGANFFGIGGIAQMPDATIMFGVNPLRAFGTDNPEGKPMVELDYVEGDLTSAMKQLSEGRTAIVSEEFKKLKGLGIGDRLELETTVNGKVEYTIVGVVRSPGIDMIVRLFQVEREFNQWTNAAVLTDIENVKRDFGVSRFQLFAANLDAPEADKREIERRVNRQLGTWGLLSSDARSIKRGIEFVFARLLDLASSVALMAILVASVGVTNTIMASVRTRQWQFGVLRSVGLTRWALLRLVMAEAVMISLVAVVLGVGGGLLLCINANGMAGHIIGIVPEMTIFPEPIWIGSAITAGVAIAASILPAFRVAYSDTLRLLQAGRATA